MTTRIVDEVAPGPGEAVLDKLTMSAYEGTPLAYVLRDCGVVTVVLAGSRSKSRSSRPPDTPRISALFP